MNFLVLHGPNLNLLGEREPGIYGSTTLEAIDAGLVERARVQGHQLRSYQSNSEGSLLDRLHAERGWADAILINPGALTHSSYVLRDAIEAVGLPTFEVHLSDLQAREPWRRRSVIREVCEGQVSGHGARSYELALDDAMRKLASGGTRATSASGVLPPSRE